MAGFSMAVSMSASISMSMSVSLDLVRGRAVRGSGAVVMRRPQS
jgi:hypothetical protein